MEVRQVFPPRPHTCGSHQEKDEQNVSKAVSVLIFMEEYTFDVNPMHHKTLDNQNNLYKSSKFIVGRVGDSFFFFLLGLGIFLVKYFPVLSETWLQRLACCHIVLSKFNVSFTINRMSHTGGEQ